MSNELNLDHDQGSDFSLELTIKDGAGVAKNITGYTFRGQARLTYDSPVAFSFSFTVVDAVNGRVDMKLPNADSTLIGLLTEKTTYLYDVEAEDTANLVEKLMRGKFKVTPEVTR